MTKLHSLQLKNLAFEITKVVMSHRTANLDELVLLLLPILERSVALLHRPKTLGLYSEGRLCSLDRQHQITNKNRSGVCTDCWQKRSEDAWKEWERVRFEECKRVHGPEFCREAA